MKICPKCQKEFDLEINFCSEDGEQLIEKTHFLKNNISNLPGENKVLAGGNVTQNISSHTENKIFNEDESKQVMTCSVSKRKGVITDGAICESCHEWALNKYFNTNNGICQKCEHEQFHAKEFELREMVRQFLSNDHALDKNEWDLLDAKSQELGLSQKQKLAIVEEERQLDTDQCFDELSPRDKSKVNSAREFYEVKGDPQTAFKKLEGLCEIYPKNKELAELYVMISVEANPTAGMSMLNNHQLFRHDSAIKSIRKIEMYESQGWEKKADQEERLALKQFGQDPFVKGKLLERLIDLYYKDDQESIQSEEVRQELKLWKKPEPLADPYLHYIEAYISYFLGNRNTLEPLDEYDPARFYLLRRFRQDTVGKFAEIRRQKELEEASRELKVKEEEYRCQKELDEERHQKEIKDKAREQEIYLEKRHLEKKERERKQKLHNEKLLREKLIASQSVLNPLKMIVSLIGKLNPFLSAIFIVLIYYVLASFFILDLTPGGVHHLGSFLLTIALHVWLARRQESGFLIIYFGWVISVTINLLIWLLFFSAA